MKKIKLLIITVLCVTLSSCGIFKKDCNCPHFGKLPIQQLPVATLA